MASEPIVYQRKPNASKIGASMEEEEEVKKQSPQGPHTPAKQIQNRTQKTYSRNPGKKNTLPSNTSSSSSSSASDVSTITDSPEKSNEGKQPFLPDLNIACCEEPRNNFSQETNINSGSDKITETIAANAPVGDSAIATEKKGNNWEFVLVDGDRLLPSFHYNDQSNEERKIPAADPLSDGGSTSCVASKKPQHNLKKRPNNGVDLDKRPRKKPKKKIHRPKVVGEGKPRTLAPKTPTKRAPELKKPKPAPKSEKPKPAAKKCVSSKKNMSGKRKNVKNLEKLDTPPEEVIVEKTDSDPVGSLAVSLNMQNHSTDVNVQNNSTDENTSTIVIHRQRQKNGYEMPESSIPHCERSDLCQAVEGPVRDCSTNQSVSMEKYQNHYGENDDLSFPKNLQKLRSKRRRRSEWKAIVIGVNKASKKSMVGRRNYVTRFSRRIETALLNKLPSLSHPKKKRTKRCIAGRNLAISNASTILNQLPIAPLGEALGNGRHEIEVSQMDEANKEAYQLPIAPLGEAFANGRHEIEVSQMGEAIKEAYQLPIAPLGEALGNGRHKIEVAQMDEANKEAYQLPIAPLGEALANGRHKIEVAQMDEANKEAYQLPIAPLGEALGNGRHEIEVSQMDEANKEAYQLPIAPLGEALGNGRYEIEVSQMDEANKKVLFAEERVTEMQIEEHKNLQHADKSRGDSEERSMRESAEIIPSHLYTEFHIGLIEESLSQEEDFVFTAKSIGDYKMKGSNEMASPLVLEFNPFEHDKPYLTANLIDMNDKSGGLLDVFPSEYGAPVPCQILQDQNVDIPQASQHNGQSGVVKKKTRKKNAEDTPQASNGAIVPHNGQSADVKKKPRKKNANIPEASDGAIVPHNGQSAVVERKTKNRTKYDPRFKQMWKFQLKYLTDESEERKKFWESERTMFKGRIDAFTARMHQILGDRRFSPWKGSVLDSVIGVYLTQNVSDFLSSSTFMMLAAIFPAQPSSQDPLIDFSQESVGSNTEYIGPAYTSEECETEGVINLADNDIPTCLSKDCSIEAKDDIYLQNNGTKAMAVSEFNLQAASDANSTNQERQKGESSNSKEKQPDKTNKRKRKEVSEKEKLETDWDAFRKMYCTSEQRRPEHMDSVDWEAVRNAGENVIAKVIHARGQNNVLARRIKEFLDRLVELHSCLDLEWLRHAPPDKVKEYLLQFKGLGLKSVECVRLLELQNVAFPVDTNVGRIAVRLGWVPLQPLPERLQIHLLQQMPLMDSIQKYLWPRLNQFDHKTLYELHYHLITFGKVFCQKTKPSCNTCPMKAECRHYASEFASARGALPGPTNTSKASSKAPIMALNQPGPTLDPMLTFLLEANWFSASQHQKQNVEPIIEVLPSPEPAASQPQKQNVEPIIEVPPSPEPASCEPELPNLDDIEDSVLDDPDDMPTINLSTQESTGTMNSWSAMLHDDDVLSRDLVPLSAEAASMRVPKLKYASRLRTKHEVYELPDHHPLLIGFERRDAQDPYPYLLAIRAPGESSTSSQPSQTPGEPCSSSSTQQNHHTVDGSILIPCRTAMRGSFPLNGTYFQVNEVFLDFKTSLEPIQVPRGWIWDLQRRTAYFGTSSASILRGLSTEEIQQCFWAGFICLRSFDREQRCPKPLGKEFHIPTNQQSRKAKINEEDDE